MSQRDLVHDPTDLALRDPRELAGCAACCLYSLRLLYDRWLCEPNPAHWMEFANSQRCPLLADAELYRVQAVKCLERLAGWLVPALSGSRLRTLGWGAFAVVSRAPVAAAGVAAESATKWACRFAEKVLKTVEGCANLPGGLVSEHFRQRRRTPGARWTLDDPELARLQGAWAQVRPALLELVTAHRPDWQHLEAEVRWEYGQLVRRNEQEVANRAPTGPTRQQDDAEAVLAELGQEIAAELGRVIADRKEALVDMRARLEKALAEPGERSLPPGSAGAGPDRRHKDAPPADGLAAPWEGDDWDAQEPLVRRLLLYMRGREKADLRELCPEVWGKDYADVSAPARETATSKANRFLAKRQARRTLHKVSGEPVLCWQ
jgi:hypothetical protein